jgi:hypothetical protein
MRRVVHKMRPNRWGMLVGPVLIAAPYFVFMLFTSGIQLEYATGIMSTLWIGFVYFIRYALALLLVSFVIIYMLRVHRGVSSVSYRTYIDDALYTSFNRISCNYNSEERIFWEAQRNIALKKSAVDSTRPISDQGIMSSSETRPVNTVEYDHQETQVPMSMDSMQNRPEPVDTVQNVDPLAELPEYDPNGPNPFA